MESMTKGQIDALKFQLAENEERYTATLKINQQKSESRCSELEIQLQLARDKEDALLNRLNECSVTENQLRDKVLASENEFASRLQASAARERELTEKLNQLQRQLEVATEKAHETEVRLKLVQEENVVLRQNKNNLSNGQTSQGTLSSHSQMLQDEVKSLHCVLELKQNEISELRKQNHELQSAHDELPRALLKISSLESRLEDLKLQYQARIDEEK